MRLLRGDRTSSHSVISEPTEFLFVWCPPFADPQVRSLNKAHVSISKSIEIEALKNGVINIKGLRSRFSEAAEKREKEDGLTLKILHWLFKASARVVNAYCSSRSINHDG